MKFPFYCFTLRGFQLNFLSLLSELSIRALSLKICAPATCWRASLTPAELIGAASNGPLRHRQALGVAAIGF